MLPINKLSDKLIIFLALSAAISLSFWSNWRDPLPLLAQSPVPTPTPVIGDLYFQATYPHPPTPTPTRIPDNSPPQTTIVSDSTPNSQNWYRTPVTLTFVAVDNMTGLGITWHKFSGESAWQKRFYNSPPLTITVEGTHT